MTFEKKVLALEKAWRLYHIGTYELDKRAQVVATIQKHHAVMIKEYNHLPEKSKARYRDRVEDLKMWLRHTHYILGED